MQRKPFVVFATPCFSGQVAQEFCMSLAQAVGLLVANDIRVNCIVQTGLQFVDVARNIIVKRFLESHPDATDLFFIDDDVGFDPSKALEFVMRPQPVVAGVYPMKVPFGAPPQWPVFLHTGQNEHGVHFLQRNGLIQALSLRYS